MKYLLSRKDLKASYFDRPPGRLAWPFEGQGWRYKVCITLQTSNTRPAPYSVEIKSSNNDKEMSFTVTPEQNDRRRFAEFVFLLSAKLKYDLLCGIHYDGAGFLHSKDIIQLNKNGLTKVQQTVHAALNTLYRNAGKPHSPEDFFLRKFFVNRDQLRHLIYSCGYKGSTAKSQDIIWWLNTGPEDVLFLDKSERIIDNSALKKELARLFPEKHLLKDKELEDFRRRLGLDARIPAQQASQKSRQPVQEHHRGIDSAESLLLMPHKTVAMDILESIETILKINSNEPSKWFRKSGPIAADFADDKVYCRRRLLEHLKNLVLENCFSMLEGIAATGKSVLVRNLAYELFQKDNQPVYYFDCDLERDFDFNELVKEINSVKGVFILENIHLETPKFQRLFGKVKQDKCTHVLFTTRPSFRENYRKRDSDLTKVKSIRLEPFDDVDKIIVYFASHHSDLPWPKKVLMSIMRSSDASFWLLSYALQGYVKDPDKSEGGDWLKKGVQDDLAELEKLDFQYPALLVSLSPLYSGEVLTDESFLTNSLGFNQKVIDSLVRRGDVTKQKVKGEFILYGLLHSALAEAYWKYGGLYRKRMQLPEYKDFIYNYATSDVCNGLEAVVKTKRKIQQSILTRLNAKNKITEVIAREQSISAINAWLEIAPNSTNLLKEDLLDSLAEKITGQEKSNQAGFCISSIYKADQNAGKKLCGMLDVQKLVNGLNREKDVLDVGCCIDAIYNVEAKIGKKLCGMLDFQKLAKRLSEEKRTSSIGFCINTICRVDSKIGRKLGNAIDLEKLASTLNQQKFVACVSCCVDGVNRTDLKIARKLCRMLDVQKIINGLNREKDVLDVGCCINAIYNVDSKIGQRLCSALDLEKLASALNQEKCVWNVGFCVAAVNRTDLKIARKLCSMLDLQKLVSKLNQQKNIHFVGRCIKAVYEADSKIGKKLLGMLDLPGIAKRLRKVPLDATEEFLSTIEKVNKAVADKLRKLLQEE